jgi:hypothetical protein
VGSGNNLRALQNSHMHLRREPILEVITGNQSVLLRSIVKVNNRKNCKNG